MGQALTTNSTNNGTTKKSTVLYTKDPEIPDVVVESFFDYLHTALKLLTPTMLNAQITRDNCPFPLLNKEKGADFNYIVMEKGGTGIISLFDNEITIGQVLADTRCLLFTNKGQSSGGTIKVSITFNYVDSPIDAGFATRTIEYPAFD
ncbi:hypothetical protein H4219_004956 [Mycoemilia scoparia]|uniref:Uncharacterized protein n=1 Tax=Mycoemilia scoparia TaxID=417184 RepID=A0A9W7ZPV6_9FUNG|nr:hypothetical protein H4219_004956 [Mycoemilia scoparia]